MIDWLGIFQVQSAVKKEIRGERQRQRSVFDWIDI